ncbi:ADP-glyceromanno-heptose 6-epimerase [Hippea jasoniae]|uniref:ADP-glyceromanno-heptose 6-epimerase n=1 Tax=Hippea jasoniae TaxID=944479 RepID=UPI0005520CFA|nr:ADP-glyceromanno-heptose 6-epimerase [Hippea jasoniae]
MIVVTGGAGFIGSNIVRALNKRGVGDIIIVDNLENSKKHLNLNALRFLDFVDKRDFIENLDKFDSFDVIFHQGACSNTLEQNGRYMMQNNYEYSKKLFEFASKNNIRFIYASSASVYGNGENGFKEEEKCEYPLNIYAFSKFLFDRYVNRFLGELDIQVVGLRYFNVYGPNEAHKGRMASVVYHFHNEILEEETIKLFEGSENFKRDFVYIDDVADVNMFFFENPHKSGIFNVGSSKAESFLKIAEIMQGLYKNVRIEFIKFPDELKGKYQTFTQADLSKLREAGYMKKFTPLEVGVRQYVEILKTSGGILR